MTYHAEKQEMTVVRFLGFPFAPCIPDLKLKNLITQKCQWAQTIKFHQNPAVSREDQESCSVARHADI